MRDSTPRTSCAYVRVATGQRHLYTAGEGPLILLMHWYPASGRTYHAVLPELARLGYRAVALDLASYGRSDRCPEPWSIEDYARDLEQVLRALDELPVVIVAGHLSAAIATELAVTVPQLVPRLVLDGSPALTSDESNSLMSGFAARLPQYPEEGNERTFAADTTLAILETWDPDFVVSPATVAVYRSLLTDLLESDRDAGPSPLLKYDMRARLPLLRAPVLALTAENEPLRPAHEFVLASAPDVRGHCFPGSHPLMYPARAGEYADVIHRFACGDCS